MADTPNTLLMQLSRRVANFLSATGLTHKELARVTGCSRSALTEFLSTGRGLSAERSLRLMQVLSASKQELVAKFGGPATARVVHFQSQGKPMRLSYGGSLAGTGPDRNDGDITSVNNNPARSVPDQDELEFLAGLAGIHQSIIDKISDWQQRSQKAKPNANGSTESPRTISRPKTPGSRGDLL